MEEKFMNTRALIQKMRGNKMGWGISDDSDIDPNRWYSETKKKFSFSELISELRTFIKNKKMKQVYINQLLDTIPEEDIQGYLRAKKLKKIKGNI